MTSLVFLRYGVDVTTTFSWVTTNVFDRPQTELPLVIEIN